MVNRFTLSFLRTHPRTNLLDAWRLVSSYPLASTHTAGFSAHASISAEAASFKSIPPTAQSLVRLLYSLALGLRTFAFLTKTKHMTIGMTHVHLTNIPRLVRWWPSYFNSLRQSVLENKLTEGRRFTPLPVLFPSRLFEPCKALHNVGKI